MYKPQLDKWIFVSWILIFGIGYMIHYFSDLPLYASIGIVIIAFLGNSYMIKVEDKEEYKLNTLKNKQKIIDYYDDINIFIEALEKYTHGKITLKELEYIFKYLESDYNLVYFHHYLSDEDIREEDAIYRKMQEDALAKFITALKNKEYHLLNEITFLG